MAGNNPALMLSKRNFDKYRGKWVVAKSRRRINQILSSTEGFERDSEKDGRKRPL